MSIGAALLGFMLILALAPETPAAHRIRHYLVDRPARALLRIHRGHVAVGFLVVTIMAAFTVFLDLEALRIAMMAAPDVAAVLTAIDAATLLDIGIAALAAWSLAGTRRLGSHLIGSLSSVRLRRHSRERRSRPTAIRAANDDDECPQTVLAA